MPTSSGHTRAIRAKKAIGTAVYNTQGDKIGSVEDIVLDKLSNNIMYAVVSFGGFLKIGEKYHPLPWGQLTYDEGKDGYVVPYTKEQLQSAPAADIDALTSDRADVRRRRAVSQSRLRALQGAAVLELTPRSGRTAGGTTRSRSSFFHGRGRAKSAARNGTARVASASEGALRLAPGWSAKLAQYSVSARPVRSGRRRMKT